MRFQKLVFRTIPHSLVEWLDGELEKRGIDCVYTHSVLSILQGDSDDIEPDEFIGVKNNQQKVFQKYGGPESLFSVTKSKHQKWKTYSKQILLTTSNSCSDLGISDLEQKNKIAAVNCLKSVSDDNSIEDLIEELCLKLKNIKTINAPEKQDSLKSLKIVDKDTAFYIPPSSPTDQVEKYFAAFPPLGRQAEEKNEPRYFASFPPLDRKVEEKNGSSHVAHFNAWYNNCIGKSKNIVQDIFKNSNLNSFQSSEISIYKQSDSCESFKSIEKIYKSDNKNGNAKNLCKISFPCYHDDYTQLSVKNLGNVDNNSLTVTNLVKKADSKIQMYSENMSSKIPVFKTTDKLRNQVNKINIEIHKSEADAKRKSLFLSTTPYQLPTTSKNIKNTSVPDMNSNKLSISIEDENSKITSDPVKREIEKLIKCDNIILDENDIASEIPCKKFKSCEKDTESEIENICPCDNEKLHEVKSCFEEADKIGANKVSAEIDALKYFTNVRKKKKSKSSKKKSRVTCSAVKDKIKSKISGSEYGNFCSEDVKTENICITKTGKLMKENINGSASEMNLCVLDCFKHEDRCCKEKMNAVEFMENNIKKDTCSVVEINCAGSNAIVFCDKNKIQSVSLEKSFIRSFDQNKKSYINNTTENISETSAEIPLYCEEISHQNFTLPLANINLIIFENNIYYNFNPTRASHFFSPHEIFEIITVGDVYEVKNFLKNFSLQTEFDLDIFHNSDTHSRCYINDFVLANQDTKYVKFHCVGSNNDADCPSMMKFSNPSLQLKNGSENRVISLFTDDQQVDSKNTNSCQSGGYFQDVQFRNSNSLKEVTEHDTPRVFGNWNYNTFFDLYKENTGNLNYYEHVNDIHCTFPAIDYSLNKKTISEMLPNKKNVNENDCRIDSLEKFYNVKNEAICTSADKVTYDDYVFSPDNVLYNNCDFKGKYLSSEMEIQPENKFLNFLQSDTVGLGNKCDIRAGSAFKVLQKIEQPHLTHNLSRNRQNILKKIINIDRVIHRINAKNRVASFLNNVSFTLPLDISSENTFHSSINTINSSFNSYKDPRVNNFMQSDSYVGEKLFNANYEHYDCPNLYCTSGKSLRSIWENKNSSLEYIWKKGTESVESEDNSQVASDSSNLDTIHKEFEEEQEELLKDIYSLPDLKEEEKLYSDDQSISNQIYENSYALNIVPGNESVAINAKEFTRVSGSMHDVMPIQTVTNTSENNKTFHFSLSVPHDEPPVGVFSLDNCKPDAVHPQITCSDISYNIPMENDAYQESDFIDVSAFRGPYGSYSESRTNCIEGGGWSLESDNYLLESEAFHDRSSSLHDLNTTASENGSFQFMPLDRQQLSPEDDEMVRMNAARCFPNNMRRRIKHKCPISKRPCAFYMEGNCNRNDCKFSHDLSNITCRFWQEGSCFKGSTCPFLHGYPDNQKILDQHQNLKKCELEHNYSLDSEADFPSLSVAKSEKTSVVKSEPLDIVPVKGFKNLKQTNH